MHNPVSFLDISLDSIDFYKLLSPQELIRKFEAEFHSATSKGIDRVSGYSLYPRRFSEFSNVSEKCLKGTYRFSPYLENLKSKGRDKAPRIVSIPSVRDRVVLSQLKEILKNHYRSKIKTAKATPLITQVLDSINSAGPHACILSTDITAFYDSINREKLLADLDKGLLCKPAIDLIRHAISTPTIPKNSKRTDRARYKTENGVPQGLSISNILAAIYMNDIDQHFSNIAGVSYFRYVDDIILIADMREIQRLYRSLKCRLSRKGLKLHKLNSGKCKISTMTDEFQYLGYIINGGRITIRQSSVENFLRSIASKISEFKHNKSKRLSSLGYLTEERHDDIFMIELNERITGAISGNKRYGWVAYFSGINELSILHQMDSAIQGILARVRHDLKTLIQLKKVTRTYFEQKFNPQGGYIVNYDAVKTTSEKLKFLIERGRVSNDADLTDAQIDEKFDVYRKRIISRMQADESDIY